MQQMERTWWNVDRAAVKRKPGTPAPDKLLSICIPTVPRHWQGMDVHYLEFTLELLLHDLPPAISRLVRVDVVKNTDKGHPDFDRARQRYASLDFLKFHDDYVPFKDPVRKGSVKANNKQGKPGHEVRKQNMDFSQMLPKCAKGTSFVMIMEDDFFPCPNAMANVIGAVSRCGLSGGQAISVDLSISFCIISRSRSLSVSSCKPNPNLPSSPLQEHARADQRWTGEQSPSLTA